MFRIELLSQLKQGLLSEYESSRDTDHEWSSWLSSWYRSHRSYVARDADVDHRHSRPTLQSAQLNCGATYNVQNANVQSATVQSANVQRASNTTDRIPTDILSIRQVIQKVTKSVP